LQINPLTISSMKLRRGGRQPNKKKCPLAQANNSRLALFLYSRGLHG
jgi:hypothetical protein